MPMDAALKAKLASMKNAWKAAKEDPASQGMGYVTVPDGRYIATLTAAEVATSNAGNLQIVWTWTVDEGEQAGNTTKKFDSLERVEGFPFIIRDLRKLGVDVDSLDFTEMPNVVESLANLRPQVKLRLVTKKSKDGSDFQNCWLDELLDYTNEPITDIAAEPQPA